LSFLSVCLSVEKRREEKKREENFSLFSLCLSFRQTDRIVVSHTTRRSYQCYGGCFLRTHFFLRTCPQLPHTSSHMPGHHPATVRRAGRKRGARFEGSEALAEQPAVARTAVELHGCCARVSLAEALLNQHIERVERALLGAAHHVGARRREPHGSRIS